MPDHRELKAMAQLEHWREHPAAMVRDLFSVNPDPWQEEALEGYPHAPRLAMKAPICVDETVWTPQGLRRWGSINVGDTLFAEDGSPTLVVNRFDAGVVPLFRVWFRDGTSLRVCGRHEWKVQTHYDRKRRKAWRRLSTDELLHIRIKTGQGQRVVRIPSQGPAQFPAARLPTDPYLFGLWLGDGIANEPRLICPDHNIRQLLRERGHVVVDEKKTPKRVALSGWLGALRDTGASHCRSYEKFIPEKFKFASVQQRLDLLRGLMDSDGTCAKNGHCNFASCSVQLIDDFIWLARSLGFIATKLGPYPVHSMGKRYRDSYRAVLCGPLCPFLADTKKRRRWRQPEPGKYSRFIDRIEPDGVGEAMCVEIAHRSHCLQAGEFITTSNCKGPGKTTVLAWIAWNFLLTRPQPKVLATSISGDNLADGLWAEMEKWRLAPNAKILQKHFEWTKTRIYHKGKFENTWWMAARQWSQSADKTQQANTLAGRHADYILFLLDESGGIPDAVMVTAEAALSSCVEGHIVQAGNPTHLTGPLYRACALERAMWKVIEITGDPDDPNRSTRISRQWAEDTIKMWGRDHPYVLVNVLGKFPPASFNALIGPDEIREAMGRYYREFELGNAAKVLGVDVALFGDDQSVIAFRQGLQMLNFKKYRNLTPSQGASIVAREWQDYGALTAFVDATGGAGSGWVDGLLLLGKAPVGVQFAGHAHASDRYANKRAEMYFDAVNWIKRGGALPKDDNLLSQLTATTYTYEKRGDRFLIEPKELVKAKLNGHSPDEADAFALTFAEPVSAEERRGRPRHEFDYNPFSDKSGNFATTGAFKHDYDPFGNL